jgi:ABC-type multidrug transport system fused ATPase/permease subunit
MTTEAEVEEQTNSVQGVRPSETRTPGLADPENQDLSMPAIEFRNVHFSFDDEKVLDGISLQRDERRDQDHPEWLRWW